MPLITSQENILMAYRKIKRNSGSHTAGTDKLTIGDIEVLNVEEVVKEVRRRLQNYRPKAVRRIEIPKPNGKTRPLGIPCIWDRLIQQCILQILEPICEARFSDNSYGFRPLRSAENAIAAEMRLINQSHLYYIVEVDIKSFFDEVDHVKLLNQLWAIGIRDKKLLSVIKAILRANIQMPDGTTIVPTKGTPQGGILSPLLANVVLNELDQWIDGQWESNPVVSKYSVKTNKNGSVNKGNGYRAMRKTNLKEMHIVRYADDVRILCVSKTQANRVMIAVKQFLHERLRLEVSEEKTRVVNVKKSISEFLGFSLKTQNKANKDVVKSHICDKAKGRIKASMKKQVKAIQRPKDKGEQIAEVLKYNAMVRGVHNYYQIATEVNLDFTQIAWVVNHAIESRLKQVILKQGAMSKTSQDYKRYGKSEQIRFIGTAPMLPLAYVQTKNAMCRKYKANKYTKEGRAEVHKSLNLTNGEIMLVMAEHPIEGKSVEYNDNRISLFAGQKGRCAITGTEILSRTEVHCHHKKPIHMDGTDEYSNLVLVTVEVHRLIHAKNPEIISQYLNLLKLTQEQKKKLNKLREMAGCEPV